LDKNFAKKITYLFSDRAKKYCSTTTTRHKQCYIVLRHTTYWTNKLNFSFKTTPTLCILPCLV